MQTWRIKRYRSLVSASRRYSSETPLEDIERIQLANFNQTWKWALENRAFYQRWQQVHALPDQISSLEGLRRFPVLTKSDLSTHETLVFAESDRRNVYSTGGSTSEPTHFPSAKSEMLDRWLGNYLGRLWWDIKPNDSRLLVWGHSHLYGTGVRATVRKNKQYLKDYLTRTTRVNGYVTELETQISYLETLLKARPTHIVGYTSAVARLAHAADRETRERVQDLRLKGVVVTADSLSDDDEVLIAEAFSAPVIIEYGAAETGVLAISRDETRKLQVLWNQCILMSDPNRGLLYTSTNERQFPLVNYELGDSVHARESTRSGSHTQLSAILGRSNDLVSVRKGTGTGVALKLWCVQLTQIMKAFGGIRAIQFEQKSGFDVIIFVEASSDFKRQELVRYTEKTLEREFPDIDTSSFEWDFESPHQKSVSGKHVVLRR